jgi:hypothetical protein
MNRRTTPRGAGAPVRHRVRSAGGLLAATLAAASILSASALADGFGHHAASGHSSHTHAGSSPPARGHESPPGHVPPRLPLPQPNPLSASSLMANIDTYASLPNHYSGTPNDAFELGVISSELASDGLQLGQQAYSFPQFQPTRVALTVGSQSEPAAAIAPLQYSGVTPPGGVTGQLYYGGKGTSGLSAGEGKIIVLSGESLDNGVEAAAAAGAKAVIAVTQGYANDPKWEDINSRDGTGSVPVILIGKQSGVGVVTAAEAGDSANVVLQAQTAVACDRDVWGVLPGRDPSRRVFVGTPASSMVPAASERGSGDAILLGLARHYAELPLSQRPETLVFLFTTGHEVGFLGLPAFIAAEGSWFTGADAYVHLGSSLGAPTATEAADGTVTVDPVPDPSGVLHYSENPLMEAIFPTAFTESGVTLPATPGHVATGGEQVDAYTHGVPTIGFSGGSLYFHTAADLPNTIDTTLLTEEAEGFRRTIDGITALAPGALKAANGQAETYGATINPATRDPRNPVLGAAGVGGPEPQLVSHCDY